MLTSVLLGADGKLLTNDYESKTAVPEREDDIYSLGLDAKYLINNNFDIKAGYNYVDRDSNIVDQDYNNNIFTIGLTSKL